MRLLLLFAAALFTAGAAPANSAEPGDSPPASGWTPPSPGAAPALPITESPKWPPGVTRRNCTPELVPLLAEAEEKGKAAKAAAATKQKPVACQAFRNLADAEGKLVKYFDEHGAECGVPADAVAQRKSNYLKIVELRTKLCTVAPAAVPSRIPEHYPKDDQLRCTPQLKGTWVCGGR